MSSLQRAASLLAAIVTVGYTLPTTAKPMPDPYRIDPYLKTETEIGALLAYIFAGGAGRADPGDWEYIFDEEKMQGTWPGRPDQDPLEWCYELMDVATGEIESDKEIEFIEPLIRSNQPLTLHDVASKMPEGDRRKALACPNFELNVGFALVDEKPYDPQTMAATDPRGISMGTADFRFYAVDLPNDKEGVLYIASADRSYHLEQALALMDMAPDSYQRPAWLTGRARSFENWNQILSPNEVPTKAFDGSRLINVLDLDSCGYRTNSTIFLRSYIFLNDRSPLELESDWIGAETTRLESLWPHLGVSALVRYDDVVSFILVGLNAASLWDNGNRSISTFDWYTVDLDNDLLCQSSYVGPFD